MARKLKEKVFNKDFIDLTKHIDLESLKISIIANFNNFPDP